MGSVELSGYAETGTYTGLSATWTVPNVAASTSATYSSPWIGVDGFDDTNLIKTGTEEDFYGGAAHCNALWWTFTAKQGYDGGGASAEWVVEAPEVGGNITTLAHYTMWHADLHRYEPQRPERLGRDDPEQCPGLQAGRPRRPAHGIRRSYGAVPPAPAG